MEGQHEGTLMMTILSLAIVMLARMSLITRQTSRNGWKKEQRRKVVRCLAATSNQSSLLSFRRGNYLLLDTT